MGNNHAMSAVRQASDLTAPEQTTQTMGGGASSIRPRWSSVRLPALQRKLAAGRTAVPRMPSQAWFVATEPMNLWRHGPFPLSNPQAATIRGIAHSDEKASPGSRRWSGVGDGRGPSGGRSAGKEGCATCHRANTGAGFESPSADDTYTMNMSCHGTGLGANTNVSDGVYLSTADDSGGNGNLGTSNTPDGAALLVGGFVTYEGLPVTSSHDPTGAAESAWGNRATRGEAVGLSAGALTCTSCGDPHGSNNYRALRECVNGSPVSMAHVDEGVEKDYDSEQWGAGTSSLCTAYQRAYDVTAAPAAITRPQPPEATPTVLTCCTTTTTTAIPKQRAMSGTIRPWRKVATATSWSA